MKRPGLLLLFLLVACPAWCQSLKRVYVIDSYSKQYAWSRAYREALKTELSPIANLSFYELNTKVDPPDTVQATADKLVRLIDQDKPDLVIAGDDASLERVGTKTDPQIPVVYLGINNNPRRYFKSSPHHVTGVLERPLFSRNILSIAPYVPGRSHNVLILFDKETTADVIQRESFDNLPAVKLGMFNVIMQQAPTFEDWQQAVLGAKDTYRAIWVGLYFALHDRSGHYIPGDDVMRWTMKHTPVPVFAFWSFAVGPHLALGGIVLTGAEQGMAASAIVKAILKDHVPPDKIFPTIPSEGAFIFSRSGLAHWGIRLPAAMLQKATLLN
ncbi:ABC transporter substrate-binding protein [Chromobacterium paludis]|uniref:Sugar ABC transporter n=1 Tax=Chromobacterium paludis TaxID=2605945 RepID=A0A5C1DHY0_9NEIS|nr:hypothetical protein [Chromobacterium paludis]QEL55617.1 hypothetical protein FYK34_08550 [Chromobacterium paludis]